MIAAMAEPSSSTLQRPMEPAFDEADIDYSDIEAAYDVQMDESLDNVVVINGVPIVTAAKEQRLFEVIQKRFRTHANLDIELSAMHMPYKEDGESKGYSIGAGQQ